MNRRPRSRPAAIAACLGMLIGLAWSPPASADRPDVVVLGSGGSAAGSCMTVAGASNHATDRSRWFFGYWPDSDPASETGLCPEDEPHTEPPVRCTAIAHREDGSVELYLRAQQGFTVLYARIVDGGHLGPDSFGVRTYDAGDEEWCGAASVPVEPVVTGRVVITAPPS